jgi:hypothetical protein
MVLLKSVESEQYLSFGEGERSGAGMAFIDTFVRNPMCLRIRWFTAHQDLFLCFRFPSPN